MRAKAAKIGFEIIPPNDIIVQVGTDFENIKLSKSNSNNSSGKTIQTSLFIVESLIWRRKGYTCMLWGSLINGIG